MLTGHRYAEPFQIHHRKNPFHFRSVRLRPASETAERMEDVIQLFTDPACLALVHKNNPLLTSPGLSFTHRVPAVPAKSRTPVCPLGMALYYYGSIEEKRGRSETRGTAELTGIVDIQRYTRRCFQCALPIEKDARVCSCCGHAFHARHTGKSYPRLAGSTWRCDDCLTDPSTLLPDLADVHVMSAGKQDKVDIAIAHQSFRWKWYTEPYLIRGSRAEQQQQQPEYIGPAEFESASPAWHVISVPIGTRVLLPAASSFCVLTASVEVRINVHLYPMLREDASSSYTGWSVSLRAIETRLGYAVNRTSIQGVAMGGEVAEQGAGTAESEGGEKQQQSLSTQGVPGVLPTESTGESKRAEREQSRRTLLPLDMSFFDTPSMVSELAEKIQKVYRSAWGDLPPTARLYAYVDGALAVHTMVVRTFEYAADKAPPVCLLRVLYGESPSISTWPHAEEQLQDVVRDCMLHGELGFEEIRLVLPYVNAEVTELLTERWVERGFVSEKGYLKRARFPGEAVTVQRTAAVESLL